MMNDKQLQQSVTEGIDVGTVDHVCRAIGKSDRPRLPPAVSKALRQWSKT